MKIAIFIIMLVLKSEEKSFATSSKLCENSLSQKHVQSVRPRLSHKLEVF